MRVSKTQRAKMRQAQGIEKLGIDTQGKIIWSKPSVHKFTQKQIDDARKKRKCSAMLSLATDHHTPVNRKKNRSLRRQRGFWDVPVYHNIKGVHMKYPQYIGLH